MHALHIWGFFTAVLLGFIVATRTQFGLKSLYVATCGAVLILCFVISNLSGAAEMTVDTMSDWSVISASAAIAFVGIPCVILNFKFLSRMLLTAMSVVLGTIVAIWIVEPDRVSAIWAAISWILASMVPSPLAWPGRLGALARKRRLHHRAYLALDESETDDLSGTDLVISPMAGLLPLTEEAVVASAILTTGVALLCSKISDGKECFMFILPAWTAALSCIASSRMFLMQLPNKQICYLAATAALWVSAATYFANVSSDSLLKGIEIFAIQGAISLALCFALQAPIDAIAPLTLGVLGFVGPSIAIPILRREPRLACTLSFIVPAILLPGILWLR